MEVLTLLLSQELRNKMIFFNNITKVFPPHLTRKENVVLENISFKVDKGEFVSVVGRSGAGKTTLFRMLLGEEAPTEGEIFFDGQNVHKVSPSKFYKIRRRVGTIFQDYKLLSSKTVYENIAYAMEVTGSLDKEVKRDVPEILEMVGLGLQAHQFPHQLSGGEQQRTAIARALIHNPDVILADEPTGDLDPYHSRDVLNLLLRINECGTTVLLATHDKDCVNALGKRVISLRDGKIVNDIKEGRFIL